MAAPTNAKPTAPRAVTCLVALALGLTALLPSEATAIDKGMALVTSQPNLDHWRNPGPMYLIYLSSGETVLLDTTPQMDGALSPDGTRLVYHDKGAKGLPVTVMNIDGTGRQRIREDLPAIKWAPTIDWPSDDYIYPGWGINAVHRFRADGTGDIEELFSLSPYNKIRNDGSLNEMTAGRVQVSSDLSLIAINGGGRRNMLFTGAGELICEISPGCNSGIAPSGHIWCNFTKSHTYGHIRHTDGTCEEARERIVLPGPFEGQEWQYMHFASGSDDLLLMTTENKPYVGLIFDLRTDTVHVLGNYLIHDFLPLEVHLDSRTPRLALSQTQLSFTAPPGAGATPESITITVTNDAQGTLDTVTVTNVPSWLDVQVQGSGNGQSLVNTLRVENLPADTPIVSADIQVSAANAAGPHYYKVTVYRVEMREPVIVDNAATGVEYAVYDGSFDSIPDVSVLNPSQAGTASGLSQVPLPPADACVRVVGYIAVGTAGVYTFTIQTDGNTAARVLIGDMVVAGTDLDTVEAGLMAGLHPITIEWLHTPGQNHPLVTMTATGKGPVVLDGRLLRDMGGAADAITVMAPNGGEHYRIGTTMTIEWIADCIAFGSLDIRLSLNDGESWMSILPEGAVDCELGSFDWTIPATFGGSSTESQRCLVKVQHYNGPEQDVSDKAFTISVDGAGVRHGSRARGAHEAPAVTATAGFISVNTATGAPARVRILDVRGRTVAVVHVAGNGQSGRTRIAPGCGVYVYRVERSGGVVHERIPVIR